MQNKKGVILCGGQGTRLRPATLTTNKHLLPIVNEPMILYPLRTLRRLGVNDILIVTGGEHVGAFADFLGDGSDHGVTLTYRVQKEAGGIAQALALAKDFYSNYDGHVIAILGDNIFAENVAEEINKVNLPDYESLVVLSKPEDIKRFGVATVFKYKSDTLYVDSVEEKPERPSEDGYAVTGLYVYPKNVFEVIEKISPSQRGELEITDVTEHYVRLSKCRAIIYEDFWSDAGTPKSLIDASNWAFSRGT